MGGRELRVLVLLLAYLPASPTVLWAGPPPPASGTVLWYTHPAEKWENALPAGGYKALPEIRRLLFDGFQLRHGLLQDGRRRA